MLFDDVFYFLPGGGTLLDELSSIYWGKDEAGQADRIVAYCAHLSSRWPHKSLTEPYLFGRKRRAGPT